MNNESEATNEHSLDSPIGNPKDSSVINAIFEAAQQRDNSSEDGEIEGNEDADEYDGEDEESDSEGYEYPENEGWDEEEQEDVDRNGEIIDREHFEARLETITIMELEELQEKYPHATDEMLEALIRLQEAFVSTEQDLPYQGEYGNTAAGTATGAKRRLDMLRNQILGLTMKLYPYSEKAKEYRRSLLSVKAEFSTRKNVDPVSGVEISPGDPTNDPLRDTVADEINENTNSDGAYDLGTAIDPAALADEA